MVKYPCFFLLLFFTIVLPCSAASSDFISNGPLLSRTANPIYLQSLGQIPTRAAVLPEGYVSAWLDASYTNLFELGRKGENEVFLDMEFARLSLNIVYGVGEDMEIGLELPFLHFNGGYFDGFIQDFHRAFGFPNSGRERYPNGAFVYHLIRDGELVYDVGAKDIGLGDITLGFKHNFLQEGDVFPGVAWTFRFKVPTGGSGSGLGSGEIDYSLGVVVEKSISRWHFYLNTDYIIVAGNSRFSDLHNSQLLAWTGAVGLSLSKPVSIVAQLQGSTPLLHGLGTGRWDGFPLDLVIGVKGTHRGLVWGHDLFWQWSFSEDLASEGPSSDITTTLVVGIGFKG